MSPYVLVPLAALVLGLLAGYLSASWWVTAAIGALWLALTAAVFLGDDLPYGRDGSIDYVLGLAAALPAAELGAVLGVA
ncbi:MAG: hypothetical protein M3P50_06175, partial [Actinomycetota bacterium]|nr:hypothetical protein [Actinomycetota bacterium]